MPSARAASRRVREQAMTVAPNAWNSFAARRPMRPVPRMPTVLPQISRPISPLEVPPARTAASPAASFRYKASASPAASSATAASE